MIAHWAEVEKQHRAKGPMDATWSRLGDAAGTRTVGANRIEVAPGKLATPPHSHGASEEIFFVLAGSGLSWQDEEVAEVRAGDCIVHVADRHEHTLRGGPDGLDVLVFGTRHPTDYGWLPRSRAIRIGYPWVEGRVDSPWDVEAEVGELEFAEPGARPPNVVNVDEIEGMYGGIARGLAAKAGAELTGLNHLTLPAGETTAPAHIHSAEEEIFVILDGAGTLELTPTPMAREQGREEERHELRAGHVVARPPGGGMAHRFRAGESGMTLLAYGTRDRKDVAFYPESNRLFFRGLGVIVQAEHVGYPED